MSTLLLSCAVAVAQTPAIATTGTDPLGGAAVVWMAIIVAVNLLFGIGIAAIGWFLKNALARVDENVKVVSELTATVKVLEERVSGVNELKLAMTDMRKEMLGRLDTLREEWRRDIQMLVPPTVKQP